MRKIDPDGVRLDFTNALNELAESFRSVTAVKAVSRDSGKKIAAQTLMSAASVWEGFLSDLAVAYVNRDCSALAGDYVARIIKSVSDKFPTDVAGWVSVKAPSNLSREEVVRLLDTQGRNVTFKNYGAMKDFADKKLAAQHRSRWKSLDDAEVATIVATLALRNYIAHRSSESMKLMNAALSNGDLPTVLRRGTKEVKAVGHFLYSTPPQHTTHRVLSYLAALQTISSKL